MTDQAMWDRVDQYFGGKLLGSDATLDATVAASEAAALPAIAVSPLQGRLLELIARGVRARNVLEIGTLGGYSTICLGRGVGPDGRVVSLEYEPRHAEVARSSIAAAGLSGVVEVRVGRALDLLPGLREDGIGPFDLVFIDADKEGNADYVDWAIRLARPGTVIIVDNVVRGGAVADPNHPSPDDRGTRRMFDLLEGNDRVDATGIQTVGTKGYDGFVYAVVR
jgi:predicted O-methyltransferase YrrM